MGKSHRAELQNVYSLKIVLAIRERMLLVTLLYPLWLRYPQTPHKCSHTNALIPDEMLHFTGQDNQESLDWFSKASAVLLEASSASGAAAEVPRPNSGEPSCPSVGKVLPMNVCHQHVSPADLLCGSPVYPRFYQVLLVHLSLLLVACWQLLLPHHGPCPWHWLLMFEPCWLQSLSFRLMSSGPVFGLKIVNYLGKSLHPGRRGGGTSERTHCSPGSLIHPQSFFFNKNELLPVIQIYLLGQPISCVGLQANPQEVSVYKLKLTQTVLAPTPNLPSF